jgi:hypothetical protein
MTAINVSTTSYQSEDRSWLASSFGTAEPMSVTLDVSAFTAATHYPNGYIPSGTVLGKITATGLYGPYLDAASDGRQTAVGLLFASTKVPDPATTTIDVGAAMQVRGDVVEAKLPANSGIDAAGKADLASRFMFV